MNGIVEPVTFVEAPPAGPRPTRVLVVDDEENIRRLLRRRLEKRGYDCEVAASAQEASARLAERPFDAVISDVRMPGGSGLDLAETMRDRWPDIPVLLLTGVEDVRTAVQALKSGVSDYLLKPLDLDQLLSSVNRALKARNARRRMEERHRSLEEVVARRTEELQQALQQVRLTCDATIDALGTALDYRDRETHGHSRRVAYNCRTLAQALGVRAEELQHITYGAYLHDIGKIAVPDAILNKPAALTPEEQAIMRTHVEIGYHMLQSIPFLQPASEIVLAHHEAWDGSGYPRGLKGKEIPLGARLFAIVDTLDAITSDRPYRKARPLSAAREEILRCAGTQFDPQIAALFLNLPESAWILAASE